MSFSIENSPTLKGLVKGFQDSSASSLAEDMLVVYEAHKSTINKLLPIHRVAIKKALTEYCTYLANCPPEEKDEPKNDTRVRTKKTKR